LAEERTRIPPFGDGLEEERESVVYALVGVMSRQQFNTSRKDLGQDVMEEKRKLGDGGEPRLQKKWACRLSGSDLCSCSIAKYH
jgi:hypothetical protein